RPIARRKCEIAQSARYSHRNVTKKTRSADAWTTQKIEICRMFGSTESNLSKRSGDRNARGTECGEQAADRSHHRGKDEATDEKARGDSKLERELAEAGHVHRAGRQTMDRQGDHAADHAADQSQRHRFGEKGSHDAQPRETERAQRPDLARPV